jgi:ribosomal protein S2
MKVKKVIKNVGKLIKLQLLKTKTFNKKQYIKNIKIEDIEYRLKKALQIIFKYHTNNKRIAFIGIPNNISDSVKFLFKNTKHIMIPESLWINGILTNQYSNFKYLLFDQKTTSNKFSETLFKLKKKIDLIVILNSLTNNNALEEAFNARIPIVALNTDINFISNKSIYKVPGNFNLTGKTSRNNLFISILAATFKKEINSKN